MCDLEEQFQQVTAEEIAEKRREIAEFFRISETSAADPLAKKPTEEQLDWSAKVAAAQERLVKKFDLDALTYYYHGAPGSHYEDLQSGFIVGHSLLTAAGVPCSGEGDLKTCLAMDGGKALVLAQTLTAVAFVMDHIAQKGCTLSTMGEAGKAFIANWESEKYRKSLAGKKG